MGAALPRIDGAVWPVITVEREQLWNRNATAKACAEFLAAGILKESDFQGDLAGSLMAGLTRWVAEEGAGDLQLLSKLRLDFTTDLAIVFDPDAVNASPWVEECNGTTAPIGILALTWTDYSIQPCFCQKRVNELETYFPGVGLSVLALLERVFTSAIAGHTFQWGYEAVEMRDDYGEDDELEEMGYMSCRKFSWHVPIIVTAPEWDPSRVRNAIRQAESNPSLKQFEPILRIMLELDTLLSEVNATPFHNQGHMLAGHDGSLFMKHCCYLVWDNETCPMHHIIDEHYEQASNEDILTDQSWVHFYQLDHGGVYRHGNKQHEDGTLRHAIEALKLTIQTLVQLDNLLAWLNCPGEPKHYAPIFREWASNRKIIFDEWKLKDAAQVRVRV